MSRFNFSLQPLLNLRGREEEVQQRKVAEWERKRLEIEGRLRVCQEGIAGGKRELGESLVGVLNLDDLRSRANGTLHSLREAQRLAVELSGVYRQLEAARAILIEAARARRVVELLRDRRFAAWKRRMSKAEDAALDELTVMAAARKETSL